MSNAERSLVYWALRLANSYHDGELPCYTQEIEQILVWADELEKERGINLAYLYRQYADSPPEPDMLPPG